MGCGATMTATVITTSAYEHIVVGTMTWLF